MMEVPKDYSNVYKEEQSPVPATRASARKLFIDGSVSHRRAPEPGGIDPKELSARLFNLSKEQHRVYAFQTLQQHYTSVFQNRTKKTYRVYLNYFENNRPKEVYLVRVNKNILREVKAKMPIKGDYRLFFIHAQNECEEVEDDDSTLPYQEKDGNFNIYCRVFPT